MSGDAGYEKWEIAGRLKTRICPRKQLTDWTITWFQLFSTYKAGFLLVGGGILDQPAIYVSVMTKIESLLIEARKK